MNQHPLPPPCRIKGYVHKLFLHDMDTQFSNQWESGQVIGLCSYEKELPTLKILMDNGAVFDYLPFDAFCIEPQGGLNLDRARLTPFLCPAHDLTIQDFEILKGKGINAFIPDENGVRVPVSGNYICTVDWPEGNESGNLVILHNGQLALIPNHKILFGDDKKTLPPYKKIRQTWK